MKSRTSDDFVLAGQLEQVIGSNLGRRHWEFILLARAWKEVVGERAAAHTMPAWIKKDVLWGYVDSSSWMQELSFMKPLLLEKVNEHIRSVVIEDIRWMRQPQETDSVPGPLPMPDRELVPEQEESFRQMTGIVEDTGCRQALFHLWRTFQKKMR